MPLVTVIMPTWNRVRWLKQSVDSVLKQTFKDFEFIVVDDGSTDSTKDFLNSYYGKIHTIILQKNFGVSKARNVAISKSNSDWIAFIDSDDYWNPLKLKKQIENIKNFPDFPIQFTDEIWIRNGIKVNPKKKHQKKEGWIFQPSLNLCLISPSTVILKRELFDLHGMFDETLPVCEDYDLWLRLTLRYEVALLDQKLIIKHGGHFDQLSKRDWGMDRYRVKSINKILGNENLHLNDYIAAKKVLLKKCKILINGFQKRGNHKEVEYYQKILNKY